MNPEDEAEEDGANIDLDSQRKGKCVVLKTSTRQVTLLIISFSFFWQWQNFNLGLNTMSLLLRFLSVFCHNVFRFHHEKIS